MEHQWYSINLPFPVHADASVFFHLNMLRKYPKRPDIKQLENVGGS